MFPCPVGTYPKGIKGDPQPWVAGLQFQHSASVQYPDAPILHHPCCRIRAPARGRGRHEAPNAKRISVRIHSYRVVALANRPHDLACHEIDV